MSDEMFLTVYATENGDVKIWLPDNTYVVMKPEDAGKLSDAILTAIAPPPCPDCGRPMTRREPWTCNNCGEEMDV